MGRGPVERRVTRVCLVGADDVALRQELLSHGTSSEALSTYDLTEPYANAVGLETVSLGAAVKLLNDLDWYLLRYVDEALVLEPSVSEEEWLSRALARSVRDEEITPGESDRHLKVYGVVSPDTGGTDRPGDGTASADADGDEQTDREQTPRLVDPMFVARTEAGRPTYDLRDVEETLVVRITPAEFGV